MTQNDAAPEFAPGYKALRSAKLTFTQAILGLEALAALFATTFVAGMANAGAVKASAGAIWGLGLWLVLMLGYAAVPDDLMEPALQRMAKVLEV